MQPVPMQDPTLTVRLFVSGIRSTPYEGPSISVKETTCADTDKKEFYCLQIDYTAVVEPNNGQPEQEYRNELIERYANQVTDLLSLLFTYPIKLFVFRIYLNGTAIEYVAPANTLDDLFDHAAGIQQLHEGRRPAVYEETVTADFWVMLELLLTEYEKKPDDERARLNLPLRWYNKASDEITRTDRLISYWVAFNAVYDAFRTKNNSERDAVRDFVNDALTKDSTFAERVVRSKQCNTSLQELSNLGITVGLGNNPIQASQDLGVALSTNPPVYEEIIRAALVVIYGIRSNLFHGDYSLGEEQTDRAIKHAERVLRPLLRELFAISILGYALPTTGFVTQRKTGL